MGGSALFSSVLDPFSPSPDDCWVLKPVGLDTEEINKAKPVTIPLEQGWGQQLESPGDIPLGQCLCGTAGQG